MDESDGWQRGSKVDRGGGGRIRSAAVAGGSGSGGGRKRLAKSAGDIGKGRRKASAAREGGTWRRRATVLYGCDEGDCGGKRRVS